MYADSGTEKKSDKAVIRNELSHFRTRSNFPILNSILKINFSSKRLKTHTHQGKVVEVIQLRSCRIWMFVAENVDGSLCTLYGVLQWYGEFAGLGDPRTADRS